MLSKLPANYSSPLNTLNIVTIPECMTNMNALLTEERHLKRHSLRWLIFSVSVIESRAPSETGATPSLCLRINRAGEDPHEWGQHCRCGPAQNKRGLGRKLADHQQPPFICFLVTVL